jgi:hydrophobe/amphiphile efflux-3 (HAE3) family protein
MRARETIRRTVELACQRPRLALGLALVLALVCAGISLGLSPSTGISTFVGSGSADYRATLTDQRQFGGDAIVVLVRENLQDLVESTPNGGGRWDIGTLSELEGCLGGQEIVPNAQNTALTAVSGPKARPLGGWHSPCGELMRHHPAKVVYGPGTFLNQAVLAVDRGIGQVIENAATYVREKAQAAQKLALAQGMTQAQAAAAAHAAATLAGQQENTQLAQLALDYGITSAPTIDNAQFISSIVFDATRGAYTPKARLAYLFPTSRSALIQVRLRSGLSPAQTAQAIGWIRAAVRMPVFRLGFGGSYLVTGEPVVLNDLAAQITGQVVILLLGAVIVMAIVLLLVFGGRLRLLPLILALAAAAITFGLTALAGATLTIASIAVLPILIGLAVDYAIQFQSRAREGGVVHAAAAGAPTIGAAALATGTGFLVLLTSPVPMVRGFGVLLVIGVAVAYTLTLTAGAAALTVFAAPGRPVPLPRGLAASVRGAGELLRDAARPLSRVGRRVARGRSRAGHSVALRLPPLERVLPALTRHPGRMLAVGLALAAVGWVADTQAPVQSDVTKLVPADMPALRQLRTLERTTGISGEIDVILHGPRVATPQTVAWMVRYENTVEQHFHYVEANGCRSLCPALSLTDLFQGGTSSGAQPAGLTQRQIDGLLGAVPAYFSQAVISASRRYAALTFGLRLMPLDRQAAVVAYLRSQLHPPRGVSARLAGLSVLAADADRALSSPGRRLLMLVLGILAVGAVLLLVMRSRRHALVPLVPIVLATGWSALVVFLLGIALNPMSATLGALVIAISTEFSVLLSERFHQERRAGHDPEAALLGAYRSTGRAVIASGVTAIAGFGVLVVSNITMLRDFGWVTVVDMAISLAGVLAVLPAVLMALEEDRFAAWWRRLLRSRDRLRPVRRRPAAA